MGGGHEVAWAHFQGITAAWPQLDCGIVNFDAHFDLRPLLDGGKGSSGTPFLQIAQQRQRQGLPFDYTALGIQPSGNSASLFARAQELGVSYVTSEEIHLHGIQSCQNLLDPLMAKKDALMVTLDMDVFAAACAPGVSAPQPLGLYPFHVLPLLQHLARSGKVLSLDIAELSPRFDYNDATAHLAAAMVWAYLNALS